MYRQYSPLLNPQPTFPLNQRDFSQAVLFLFGLRRNEYQLGLSKVFFRAGKRAFLETVMNRDEKLSMDDMNALLGFIHRKKWQRLIAAAKSYALLWRSIALERLLQQWRATTRVLIIYQKTFVPALRRLRRANAARVVQAAVRTYQRRTETMNLLEKERLERQRVEMRERALKQQREQERKQKEEEERQKLLLQQQQQQVRLNSLIDNMLKIVVFDSRFDCIYIYVNSAIVFIIPYKVLCEGSGCVRRRRRVAGSRRRLCVGRSSVAATVDASFDRFNVGVDAVKRRRYEEDPGAGGAEPQPHCPIEGVE